MTRRPHENAPLLSGLFTGEVDESEAARLLERAERDPELSSELDLIADVTAAAELERASLEAELPSPPRARPSRARRARSLVALAAAAAVALSLWFLRPPASTAGLGAAEPPPFFPAELRDGADPLPARFAAAMQPYVAGAWPDASAALDEFLVQHPDHGPARFYRGVVGVELGRFDDAAADFASVADGASGYLAEHARWRGALLRLLRDDAEGARRELESLREAGGAFAPNAAALLERLGHR